MTRPHRLRWLVTPAAAFVALAALWAAPWTTASAGALSMQPPAPTPPTIQPPSPGTDSTPDAAPSGPFDGQPGPRGRERDGRLTVDIDLESTDGGQGPNRVVLVILAVTLLAVAPSLLILMTSFTRIVVVLSLVRNALGLQMIPPNQVLAGLALFLTFFVMAPTLSAINDEALQPYLDGRIDQQAALDRGEVLIKSFMLANTRTRDLELIHALRDQEVPEEPEKASLTEIVPAFVLSELQSAFIIGLVVFVPFLVIDLVVSAVLMSLGMMMLPPVFVSLPLKLVLFLMVGGWGLITESIVTNYQGVGFT